MASLGGKNLGGLNGGAPTAQQEQINQETINAEQAGGLQYYDAQKYGEYLQQGIDAMQAGAQGDFGITSLPPGTSWADFFNLESSVQQFEASAGSRYTPTSTMMREMLAEGLYNQPSSSIFRWLAAREGVAKTLPWAAAGMTAQGYEDAKSNLEATMADFTGDPNMYSELISQALQMHGTQGESWLRTQLTTNEKYTKNAKTPWLQLGKTYQQWQQDKMSHKTLYGQQVGMKATDADLVKAYKNVEESSKVAATGTGVDTGKGLGGSAPNQVGRSSVR